MLKYLKSYQGSLIINGQSYDGIEAAERAFEGFNGILTIILNKPQESESSQVYARSEPTVETPEQPIYRIKVRQYMTKPASREFDFHTKFNKDIPMPMRIMVGRKLQETRGMVKMELWGSVPDGQATHCMKCGRTLTNPVSRYFGIGPECGGHNYTNPFESEEALKQAILNYDQELKEVKWTGWIIKSALEKFELIRQESID